MSMVSYICPPKAFQAWVRAGIDFRLLQSAPCSPVGLPAVDADVAPAGGARGAHGRSVRTGVAVVVALFESGSLGLGRLRRIPRLLTELLRRQDRVFHIDHEQVGGLFQCLRRRCPAKNGGLRVEAFQVHLHQQVVTALRQVVLREPLAPVDETAPVEPRRPHGKMDALFDRADVRVDDVESVGRRVVRHGVVVPAAVVELAIEVLHPEWPNVSGNVGGFVWRKRVGHPWIVGTGW